MRRGELGGLSGRVVLRGGPARAATRERARPRLQLRLRAAWSRCALHLQMHKLPASALAPPNANKKSKLLVAVNQDQPISHVSMLLLACRVLSYDGSHLYLTSLYRYRNIDIRTSLKRLLISYIIDFFNTKKYYFVIIILLQSTAGPIPPAMCGISANH